MATAIYVRVSTDEQAKKGFSIPAQLEDCRAKAREERIDNEIIEYIDDGITGSILERPGLERLRNDIRQGLVDTVIVLDPDRLARGTSILLIITDEIERSCRLVFVNADYSKTPEGMLFYQIKGVVSEFERAKIRERTMRGTLQKIKSGKILKGYKIYGYDFNRDTGMFVINKEEADVVKMIYHKFMNPEHPLHGINHIANWLNEQEIPTKKSGGVWHRKVVKFMLENKVYTGEFVQNKEDWTGIVRGRDKILPKCKDQSQWISIKIPAIIDRTTFDMVQEKIQVVRRLHAGVSKHSYLLSGLCRCLECGRPMIGRRTRNRTGTINYYHYLCKSSVAGSRGGCNKKVKCEALDDLVWTRICELMDDPDRIEATEIGLSASNIQYEREIATIEEKLSKIDKMKTGLFELLSTPELVEDVKRRLLEANEKQQKLHIKLEELREKQTDVERNQLRKENMREVLRRAADMFLNHSANLSLEVKQNIIRMIVKEVKIDSQMNALIFTY